MVATADGRWARVGALARLFLRLGTVAFGGPAAHIAMLRQEVVDRLHWFSEQEFLDLLAICCLLPGPNSTELAILVGYRRAGWPGLLTAGICFILPAALIVTGLAWAYQRWQALPAMGALLYGIKPVILAVVIQAVWQLGRTALRTSALAVVAARALAGPCAGVPELALLAGGGLLAAIWRWARQQPRPSARPLLGLLAVGAGLAVVPWLLSQQTGGGTAYGLGPLFLVCAKIGSVLYGSGYVLLAFLQADLVDRLHWLTSAQLLDAVAVGQVTPGPVFTTATFVGYLLGGGWGALVATVGIFAPAFGLVVVGERLVAWLRASVVAGAFLDGLAAASLGLLAAVGLTLARTALVDLPTALLAGVAAVAILRYRLNATWLVLAGGLLGVLLGAG
ncbi:MAG: chromate efflux transporter [Fimbriimonadaceae bacterium]|nr:chromate efflux transporter [Fimbriimonadaceae bacterium]